MLKLLLDCREHKLIEIFPDTETKQLDIGDIHFIDENDNVKCIVERKTLNDLSSSIIDGRYKEQKCRLLSSGYKVIYIIEGLSKNNYGVKHNTLLSALLNTQLRDNIVVIRSKDINETANILVLLKEKLNGYEHQSNLNYSNEIYIKKSKNLTKEVVYKNQLSCIPGISIKIATEIIKVYPTFPILISKFQENGCNMLSTIDGIGNIISKKVYDYII